MFSIKDFKVASFKNAKPLDFFLPYKEGEETAVVGLVEGTRYAVFLSGENLYCILQCEGAQDWVGLSFSEVAVELDADSAFDPEDMKPEPGDLIRQESRLEIMAMSTPPVGQRKKVTLQSDLPPNEGRLQVAFRKWQLVLVQGDSKRVLWKTG